MGQPCLRASSGMSRAQWLLVSLSMSVDITAEWCLWWVVGLRWCRGVFCTLFWAWRVVTSGGTSRRGAKGLDPDIGKHKLFLGIELM